MSETKKILVLDDEPEILELLKHILGKQYVVHTRSNVTEFAKDLEEFRPDLLLIDHFLGDNTSSEFISQSLLKYGVPFILHSAHEDIEKLFVETNAAGFIKKPSSIAEIRMRVAKVLERSEA